MRNSVLDPPVLRLIRLVLDLSMRDLFAVHRVLLVINRVPETIDILDDEVR